MKLLSEIVIGVNRSTSDVNSLRKMQEVNSGVQKALISLIDPKLAEYREVINNSKTSAQSKNLDEGKSNYLQILSSGGAFKNLSDIMKAVASLNIVVKESKKQGMK